MGPVHGFAEALRALENSRPRVVLSSSSDRAADVIREHIAAGLFRPGARLPEEPIAESLGISRNTLREALSQLIGERLLERIPNRGVFVRTPSVDDLRDIYRARRVIEPGCLRLMPADADISDVAAAVAQGRAALDANDGDAVASANQQFHRSVVALAGSPRLDMEMSRLLAEMRLVFFRAGPAEDFHRPYVERNEEIVAALAEGRGRAAAANLLDRYLVTAEQHLLSTYPQTGQG